MAFINKNFIKPTRSATYNHNDQRGEINDLPSQTVPNEAYTVRELLAQYVRGVPLPVGKQPLYSNSDDFEDIDETRDPAFDLADASQQKRMLDASINEQKQRLARKKTDEAKKVGKDDKQSAEDETKE